MIGFPTTPFNSKITKTSNCSTRSSIAERLPSNSVNYSQRSRDMHVKHNCSVWGGNSGGPMVKAHSNIAIGLPATYRRDRGESRPSNSNTTTASELASVGVISGFVQDHRATLEEAGVDIVD
jgi:hypothetical protein